MPTTIESGVRLTRSDRLYYDSLPTIAVYSDPNPYTAFEVKGIVNAMDDFLIIKFMKTASKDNYPCKRKVYYDRYGASYIATFNGRRVYLSEMIRTDI